MTRRRHQKPVNRPDWRDESMPVLAQHKMRGLVPVTPQFAHDMAAYKLAHDAVPNWRDDPTYDLRRKQ
jgi:hypothetical protein